MEAASAYDAVSLESYRFGDEGDGETYAESIGVEDDRFELVEYGATIAPTLQALPPRDRIVLHLRFVEDLTQAEIAERVGVSQMHVSRLIRRALERLRTVAEHSGYSFPGRREGRTGEETPSTEEPTMGITDKITGRVKKAAGDLTDDASLRNQGRPEERKGEAKDELVARAGAGGREG